MICVKKVKQGKENSLSQEVLDRSHNIITQR